MSQAPCKTYHTHFLSETSLLFTEVALLRQFYKTETLRGKLTCRSGLQSLSPEPRLLTI